MFFPIFLGQNCSHLKIGMGYFCVLFHFYKLLNNLNLLIKVKKKSKYPSPPYAPLQTRGKVITTCQFFKLKHFLITIKKCPNKSKPSVVFFYFLHHHGDIDPLVSSTGGIGVKTQPQPKNSVSIDQGTFKVFKYLNNQQLEFFTISWTPNK